MSAYGDWVRTAREGLGLSREQLRRRMLLHFQDVPTVEAIRFLETGRRKTPLAKNRVKYARALRDSEIKPPPSNRK